MKKNLFTMSLLAWVLCLLLPARVMADQAEVDGVWYELTGYSLDSYYLHANVIASQGSEYRGNIEIPTYFEYEGKAYIATAIESNAFQYCSNLTSITIPASVTSIGNNAFRDCSGLTSITIPEGVMFIGDNAFEGCSGLTSITIPEGVTSIGSYAFYGCYNLTSITIPESVTSIGRYAFEECYGLISIVVESGNSVYDSRDNCNAIIETSTNQLAVGCKNTIIPESVTSIGDYAFDGCSGLTSITIPESVTSIGNYAFQYCSNLTSITISEGVTSIGDNAFYGCYNLTSITIPESVTSIGRYAFNGCYGLTSIVVESGNSVYDSRDNCNAIIESSTNQLAVGCKNTIIPESVTSIGDYAFWYCSGLTSITIPEGVTSIRNSAFYYCSGLTSITIPASVTSIGSSAFSDCSGLTSVTVKNPTPVAIYSNVFSNRANATLYVPAGSKAAYEAADVWKEFKAIVEMAPDEPAYPEIEDFAVVLDGERQTLHGKLMAQDGEEYIVTDAGVYRVTDRRERLAGDVNGDGKITIADVTGLVNVILGHAEAESATIYDVARLEGVTGFPGNGDFIGWGGTDEDGSLDPNVKEQRF